MSKSKRIFFITDTKDLTDKLLLEGLRKQVKGFIRLGHDTQVFSYNHAFFRAGTFGGEKWTASFYKPRVDELLAKQIKNYNPDIIIVSFAKFLDAQTIERSRKAAPNAAFAGYDVDIWPELHDGRIEAATKLELVLTTFDGKGLESYKKAGVRCVFIPNLCDPDIEHRYPVEDKWKSEILFTGKIKHKNYPTEDIRSQIIGRLSKMQNCALYGCCGQSLIGGMDYLYAISGARIGLSINAANDIRLYHSDRFTQYLACGTFVLAKRVPDTDLLFKDGVHLKYFDTAEEFFELADWYLKHENERKKIADAGMLHAHAEFNCQKIARYMLDAIETGTYHASWTD
jgi:spore maturation protein CgeB